MKTATNIMSQLNPTNGIEINYNMKKTDRLLIDNIDDGYHMVIIANISYSDTFGDGSKILNTKIKTTNVNISYENIVPLNRNNIKDFNDKYMKGSHSFMMKKHINNIENPENVSYVQGLINNDGRYTAKDILSNHFERFIVYVFIDDIKDINNHTLHSIYYNKNTQERVVKLDELVVPSILDINKNTQERVVKLDELVVPSILDIDIDIPTVNSDDISFSFDDTSSDDTGSVSDDFHNIVP